MTPTEFSKAMGISVPYASQILSAQRSPSKKLAVRIYRITGWRHETLANFADEDLNVLERLP